MASVHDVAAYILGKFGHPMTTWKLQKLVYYAQAWSLVWDERPLFQARIEAWANGPVVPALYQEHRGLFQVGSWPLGDPDKLTRSERETVDGVLEFYGPKTSQWLSDLTHTERPWREARGTLAPGERGTQVISPASMHEYYSGLSVSQG
ncbi:MAG: SocA family protein [Acidobacteria bacterium]|nr:SocA family protein [Acidobacteriota bacterium]